MKTIALLGGSFDPPHIAHENIVQEALKIDGVEKLVIMPTFLNPFKASFFAPSSLRLKWLKNIFKSYKNVEVSSFEVDLKEKVPSIITVKYLLKHYSKIYLIIGADNLKSLPLWHKYNDLKDLVTFVVASRDNITIAESFLILPIEEDISSTKLRNNMDEVKISQICSSEIIKFYKENND